MTDSVRIRTLNYLCDKTVRCNRRFFRLDKGDVEGLISICGNEDELERVLFNLEHRRMISIDRAFGHVTR